MAPRLGGGGEMGLRWFVGVVDLGCKEVGLLGVSFAFLLESPTPWSFFLNSENAGTDTGLEKVDWTES